MKNFHSSPYKDKKPLNRGTYSSIIKRHKKDNIIALFIIIGILFMLILYILFKAGNDHITFSQETSNIKSSILSKEPKYTQTK
ncbi:hypothetical protein DY037_05470 [Apilactobacillus micheneri]|nr:hypothetical protein DY037_05470 [Apilactobacillus micheneri]